MENQAVYIGLGGAGVCSTAHLKANLLRAFKKDREALKKYCRFLFIDTDEQAINLMNRTYLAEFNNQKLITAEETIPLFDTNPLKIVREAIRDFEAKGANPSQVHLLSFVDEKSAQGFQHQFLERGAGANRQQGRVAMWRKWRILQKKVNDLIRELKNPVNQVENDRSIPFYILSGTCGGTGSSMFLDVAYLLNRTIIRQFNNRTPSIRAVLLMPEWYIQQYDNGAGDETVRKYQCNAYAFFDELNYFLYDHRSGNDGDRGRKFGKVFVAPPLDDHVERANTAWGVFDFAILVDSTTELERKLDDQQMYRYTAEMLYHWHQPEVHGPFLSKFDNQMRETNTRGERVPAFVTMGYRSLKYKDMWGEYCKTRFLYEFFHYGIIGEGIEDFLSSDNGRKYVDDFVERDVRGRLLIESGVGDVNSNLATFGSKILNNIKTNLQDWREAFKTQVNIKQKSGWLSRLLGMNDESEAQFDQRIDPQAIGNSEKLQKLADEYYVRLKDLENRLRSTFDDPARPTSKEKIIAAITTELERFLEESVYRFGLKGGRQLAHRLSEEFKALYNRIRENKEALARESKEAVDATAAARASCERTKSENDLTKFQKGLDAHLDAEYRILIAGQQMQVLDVLMSPGGGLQRWTSSLDAIERLTTERVSGEGIAGEEESLRDRYTKVLPTRFQSSRGDATVAYLPELDRFVNDGEWKPDNGFALLYKDLIPERAYDSSGKAIWREIFERMIKDASAADGDSDGNYLQKGELVFFRKSFKEGREAELGRMPQKFEDMANRICKKLMLEKNLDRIDFSLHQEFNSLTPIEQERLREEFTGRIDMACKLEDNDNSDNPAHSLYVGGHEALARALGYSEGADAQYIRTDDPNSIIHIKVKSHYTINQYPYFERYQKIYHQERDESRKGSNKPFSPHIHKVFNQYGVQEGMRRLLYPSNFLEVFGLALIYNEMFALADQHFASLLNHIFHLDGKLGDGKTRFSLFLYRLTGEPARDAAQGVRICVKVRKRDEKLLLLDDDFEDFAGSATNWRKVFELLDITPKDIQSELEKVHEFFLDKCTSEWADDKLLPAAYENVRQQVKKELEDSRHSPAVSRWYINLLDILKEKFEKMDTHVKERSKLFPNLPVFVDKQKAEKDEAKAE